MSVESQQGPSEAEWAAVLSHEARTPLAALVAATRALCDTWTTLEPSARGALVTIVAEQSEQLAAVVAEELGTELARTAPGSCDLAALVDSTVAAARAAHPHAALRVTVPDALPAIRADGVKLGQVLTNLIDNAVIHGGPDGPIEVEILRKGERVGVAVSDHGPGIAAADQASLFERGRQAVGAKRPGSAGLGLWIARSIMVAHGGELALRSAPGEGAVFTLWLPRAAISTRRRP